jgi:hypothetical protein
VFLRSFPPAAVPPERTNLLVTPAETLAGQKLEFPKRLR